MKIRNKKIRKTAGLVLAATLLITSVVPAAAETSANMAGNVTVLEDENSDNVTITKENKPYLALGADLSEEQKNTVLSIMGISPEELADYDVVLVTNAEEHQYLASYLSASKIGSRALSSILIAEGKKGSGINISTTNINYCTVGMYKNALVTAGVTDADIIIAGPSSISGTAALVGVLKAYQEMTGEMLQDEVVDAALNELVITGKLEESIDGLSNQEVEEFLAYVKSVIAENDLSSEEDISAAIDEACQKYNVTLSAAERGQIVSLLLKITSLGIDLDGVVDYAKTLYDSYKDGNGIDLSAVSETGFLKSAASKIKNFIKQIGKQNK